MFPARRLATNGLEARAEVLARGYEGLVAKDPALPYVGGRTLKWLVHAALEIQRALRDYSKDLQQRKGLSLQMRIGINTGPVLVGRIGDDLRMDYTAVGDTTNLAARLQQLARPGSVLVSEATHNLTEAGDTPSKISSSLIGPGRFRRWTPRCRQRPRKRKRRPRRCQSQPSERRAE